MKKSLQLTLAIVVASNGVLVAQRPTDSQAFTGLTGTIIVHVTADRIPIPGATVATGSANGVTDRSGIASLTLPTGRRTLRVTPAGQRPESLAVFVGVGTTNVNFPLRSKPAVPKNASASSVPPAAVVPSALLPKAVPAKPLPPVVAVAASRDGNRVSEAPASAEVIDRDALDEQLDASPGTIAELLTRSGGVRVQPLSAGAGGAGIRVRGLPARYTKILSDGLPLYGSTPEGLDPLQIPALGLERVELTKGVSSAMYGPSALGGVVNLVSAPAASPSEMVVNGTSRLGSDVALWQTHTFSPQWAATLVAGRSYENSDDPDADGWAEVAGYRRIVARPRVYWNRSENNSWFMTGGWTSENRWSGTFGDARLPDFNKYSDDANTRRADAGTVGRIQLDSNSLLTIRASMTREWRARWYGSNQENDRRTTIFSDVSLTKTLGTNVLVAGAALERDQYLALDTKEHTYRYTTPALFAEHAWTPESWVTVTSNARLDLQSEFGDFVSPRMSVFVHPSPEWSARVSAAAGVYAPTPLTDETEGFGLSHIRPTPRQAEHATGWSLDVSRLVGALEVRGSAYRTVVGHPLILRTEGEQLELVNSDEAARTQGIDLVARYQMRPLRYTLTYSYIDATRPEIGQLFGEDFEVDTTMRRVVPLNPRHALNLDVAHERENDRLIGFEIHFSGRQALSDTAVKYSQPYVTIDARLEKHFGPVIVFARGKNLGGVHQSQFLPVLRNASSAAGQWTNDVWAPLDGRVINAGLRVKY